MKLAEAVPIHPSPEGDRPGDDAVASWPGTRPVAGVCCSLAGSALLLFPARYWRIDGAAPLRHWREADLANAAVYAIAVTLLAIGWREVARQRPSTSVALRWGAGVHAVALFAPAFLSLDPLCYAAVGHAIAHFHANALHPLIESLPSGDPFLLRLPAAWRVQGSAYSSGFNQLTRMIALIADNDVGRFVRALQLLNFAAILCAAWLTSIAVGVRDPGARGRAAALVLFCPIAIVEGTVNAHNDALMALCVAAFALAVESRHRGGSVGALCGAALVKASGFLLLVTRSTHLLVARGGGRVRGSTYAKWFLAASAIALVAVLFVMSRVSSLRLVLALVGMPDEAPHCTRSIECLPRAILFWLSHQARAAWLVGLAFRVASAAWLCYVGWRSAHAPDDRTLSWAATGLFCYYLFLHGYMQSWYLLSLLPLLPFASRRMRPAMAMLCVTSLWYYAIRLPLQDDLRPWVVGLREVAEGTVVIVPPAVLLLHTQRYLR